MTIDKNKNTTNLFLLYREEVLSLKTVEILREKNPCNNENDCVCDDCYDFKYFDPQGIS